MTYASAFPGSVRNSVKRSQSGQSVTQNSPVLFDLVLDDLRPVAHVAKAPIDPAHQAIAAVPGPPSHRKQAHRRAAVERLQPCGAVRVAEHVRPDPPSRPEALVCPRPLLLPRRRVEDWAQEARVGRGSVENLPEVTHEPRARRARE